MYLENTEIRKLLNILYPDNKELSFDLNDAHSVMSRHNQQNNIRSMLYVAGVPRFLQDFLSCLDGSSVVSEKPYQYGIEIDNCTFSDDGKEAMLELNGTRCRIKKGEFIVETNNENSYRDNCREHNILCFKMNSLFEFSYYIMSDAFNLEDDSIVDSEFVTGKSTKGVVFECKQDTRLSTQFAKSMSSVLSLDLNMDKYIKDYEQHVLQSTQNKPSRGILRGWTIDLNLRGNYHPVLIHELMDGNIVILDLSNSLRSCSNNTLQNFIEEVSNSNYSSAIKILNKFQQMGMLTDYKLDSSSNKLGDSGNWKQLTKDDRVEIRTKDY